MAEKPKEPQYELSTAEFAKLHQVKPETPRTQFCRAGHYLGVKPKKLANGRLVWPNIRVEV